VSGSYVGARGWGAGIYYTGAETGKITRPWRTEELEISSNCTPLKSQWKKYEENISRYAIIKQLKGQINDMHSKFIYAYYKRKPHKWVYHMFLWYDLLHTLKILHKKTKPVELRPPHGFH
jgi:hypothetical protein